jgi:mannosyltransferase OCH1-like enzyme
LVYSKLNILKDLWRFCILYVFGGLYLDDDSDLRLPFDEGVLVSDKAIFGFERNRYEGMSYRNIF